MSSTHGYRPEIDGLRCFAVLPVVIFHLQKNWLPGGYLGVDVFFVISGFLITSILLRQWEQGTLSLARFWNRRIRRILPAALGVLFFFSLFQNIFFFRPDLREFLGNKFAALFSYANIYSWRDVGDYWGSDAIQSPFLHFWSLAVEEQYYLFYPLLVLAVLTWLRRKLFHAILLISAGSGVLYLYGSINYPMATFYLLPTRIWELGAGCLLASLPLRKPATDRVWFTTLGLGLILYMYLFSGSSWMGGFEEIGAVLGACLVIHGSSNALSKILLENPASIWIGRWSYSIYLWHWPVIVSLILASEYGLISINIYTLALSVVIISILSITSFFLIETPLRRHKYGTAISLIALTLLALYFAIESRLLHSKSYADESQFDRPHYYGFAYNLKPSRYLKPETRWNDGSVISPPRESSDTAFKEGGLIRAGKTEYPQVVLLGDSYAGMWCKLIDELCQEKEITRSLWTMDGEMTFMEIPVIAGKPGRSLNAEDFYAYNSSRLEYIERWKPDLVIVAAIFEYMGPKMTSDFLDFLETHAGSVLLVESAPALPHVGNRNFLEFFSFLDRSPEPNGSIMWPNYYAGRIEHIQTTFSDYIENREGVYYLPIADLFLRDERVLAGHGRKVYYLDDNHLTYEGSLLAKDRFKTAIDSLLQDKDYPFKLSEERPRSP